jgi:hypothetical protein
MNTRPRNSIVYVAGDMTPMVVVESDQQRRGQDRASHRMIRLRPQTGGESRWYRSDMVTGDGTEMDRRRGLDPADVALMRAVICWCREEVRGLPRVDRSGGIGGRRGAGFLNWRLNTWAEYAERREVAVELAFAGEDYGDGTYAPLQYRMGWAGGNRHESAEFTWVEPCTLAEGIDMLVALGFLPPRFSSAYREGFDNGRSFQSSAANGYGSASGVQAPLPAVVRR